ncbi:MAG: hypothetical protein U0X73_14305 [Thermoanaerobaculia bacterium]
MIHSHAARARAALHPLAALAVLALAGARPARAEDGVIVRPLGAARSETAALLSQGGNGGSLAVSAFAAAIGPGAADASRVSVLVALGVDGRSLLASRPSGRLGIEITLYALDAGGRLGATLVEGVAIDLDRRGAELERAGALWLGRLELPPGTWRLRMQAREHRTGLFGQRELQLVVDPKIATVPPPPATGAPASAAWLRALSPSAEAGLVAAFDAFGGFAAPPAALAAPPPVALGREAPAAARRLGRDLAPLVDAAHAAWRLYAAGDRDAAISGLATFEAALLAADDRGAVKRLIDMDEQLLGPIVAHHPRAALPLALLYRDLFRAHLAAHRIRLAHRAETTATALFTQMGKRAGDDAGERRLAAAALESLAGDLIEAQAPKRASTLLEQAAAFQPDRVEAWTTLAAVFEQERRLQAGIAAADHALALEPRHREARLRRARLDLLAGSTGRGAAALERLVDEPQLDWVGVVAAQERARLWLADRKLPAAAKFLAKATRKYPSEPSLALAYAYVLERTGRRAEAFAAARQAITDGSGYGVAPRRRYAEPPVAGTTAGRAEIEGAAMLRFAELAEVAGPAPPESRR